MADDQPHSNRHKDKGHRSGSHERQTGHREHRHGHHARDHPRRSRSPHAERRHSDRENGKRPAYDALPEARQRHRHAEGQDGPRTDGYSYIPSDVVPARPNVLAFKATPLHHRHDFETYRPLFASYLDIQKQLILEDLPETESKGRWKSFVRKWNEGTLAAGWYDPATLKRAVDAQDDGAHRPRNAGPGDSSDTKHADGPLEADDNEDDSDIGPAPPPPASFRSGPGIASAADLRLRDEAMKDQSLEEQAMVKFQRKTERRQQRERQDEIAPRAEPGTRERQVEKQREVASSNKQFAEAGAQGGIAEVPDSDLMGGGEDSLANLKKREERKRTEREIRREEQLRARAAEREERMVGIKQREEKTMALLQSLAKERFG